jgi:hypothetical protein
MTTVRRLAFAAVAVVAAALMGCDTIGASMLQATFPSRGDGVQEFRIAPLPVTFWDRTGLVTAIAPIKFDPQSSPGMYAVRGPRTSWWPVGRAAPARTT